MSTVYWQALLTMLVEHQVYLVAWASLLVTEQVSQQ